MKNTFIFIVLFLTNASVFAQVSGYQGKHVILKSDLSSLVDLGGSVSIEAAVARRISIEPEYRFSNKPIKFLAENPFDDMDYQRSKIKYREHAVFLGFKLYHSKSITAPKGFYNIIKVGMGRATITGKDYYGVEVPNPDEPGSTMIQYALRNFTLKNIRTYHISASIGVNYIFAKRLVADISWGLQYTLFDAKQYSFGLAKYVHKVSPNVINFIPNSQSSRAQNFGFCFRASLGVLLF